MASVLDRLIGRRMANRDLSPYEQKLAEMHTKFEAGAKSDRTGTLTAEQTGAGPLAARRWEYANRKYQEARRAQLQRKLDALKAATPNKEV